MALKDILANIKQGVNTAQDKLINNLLGTPVQTEPYYGYSKEIEEAKNSLGDLESVQTMLGQPNAKSLEQIQQGFTQGLNYGNPEIAKLQDDLGIAKPDTNNKMQLDMAKSGMFNLPDTLHSGTSNRQGGLLNDFVGGLRENYTNAFDAENLAPNANKGAATRFGEGIGTALRFFDKPIGRGLLAGAAALALGGGAGDALAYGLGTGVGRQTYMTKDKAYRQQLKEMGLDAAEVDAIPGNITDDVFKNIVASAQAKAMTQWRIDQLKALEEDREIKNKIREEENEFERAYRKEKLKQGWAGIEADKNNSGQPSFSQITTIRKEFGALPAIKNANEIKRQFDNVANTYNLYKQGKLKANAADQIMVTTLNKTIDPTSVVRESEFARTAAGQSLFARIQGYADKMAKGGGGLTDAEREDLYRAMETLYKANQTEAQEYIKSYTDLANRYGINPADIMPRQYNNQTNGYSAPQTGAKVRVQAPNGKTGTIPIENLEAALAKGYKRL